MPGEPGQTKRWFSSIITISSLADIKRVALKSLRVEALPLRIRPAFVLLTFVSLVVLALLGFHPTLAQKISPPIPFSDKLLHFVCFFFASAQFYSIWVVEDSRRDWYWRYFPEIISTVVCLGCAYTSLQFDFVATLQCRTRRLTCSSLQSEVLEVNSCKDCYRTRRSNTAM